ncbi:MAG: creatininase family protein [Cyclobacteriaceae bacterium]
MRPFILAENNWSTIKEAKYDLAILPWGATEAHNYHLPYGTDIIEAEKVAEASAEIAWNNGAKVVVLPCIPFGVNTGQLDIALDMNLNPSTQQKIIEDVVQTLIRHKVQKLIILNSHGGNDFKPMIREIGAKYPDMFISSCDWFRAIDQAEFFEHKDDHAGEMETSVMLHLRPDLVLPLAEAGDGAAKKFVFAAMQEGWAWAERKWSSVTKDTGVGDPRQASAIKGEKYFDAVTKKVGSFFFEVATTDRNNLYSK